MVVSLEAVPGGNLVGLENAETEFRLSVEFTGVKIAPDDLGREADQVHVDVPEEFAQILDEHPVEIITFLLPTSGTMRGNAKSETVSHRSVLRLQRS